MTFTGPYAKLIISRCLCWLTGFYKGPSVKIESVNTDHYLIPLPNTPTDAMHGEMAGFTVVSARVRTDSGAEGLRDTYTVGSMGGHDNKGSPSTLAASTCNCPWMPCANRRIRTSRTDSARPR